MSNIRTYCVALMLSLVWGLGTSCQKATVSQAPEPANKSPEALAACAELNLARDAAWTATFLQQFVRCAAIKNGDRQESFVHTLQLIDSMGLERLQRSMDWFLLQPQGPTTDAVYPNLSALITLMDRGQHDERGLPLPGAETRWESLQTSLQEFRPRPVLQFLMALEEADTLDDWIQELMAWSDALPQGSLAGLTHRVLTDASVRMDLQTLQRDTLDDPFFSAQLRRLWEPHFYPMRGSSESRSLFGHLQDFWSRASKDEQQRWAHDMGAFLRMGLETQKDELLRRTQDLYELMRSYALRQPQFLSNLRALIQQALDTRLQDLEPAMKGLNQIKDNPSYRDAFEEKAGSTYLHQLIEDFLWEGGRLQSCSMEFAGMQSQPGLHDPAALLRPLLTPQAACQGRVPLLLYIDETLGLNCRTGMCGRSWMPEPSSIAAADLQRLGTFAWHWLETELRADPYRLRNRQLAYGPIMGDTLEQLKVFWQEQLPQSVEELVALDERLSHDPRFAALLRKDFLESWYGLVLQKLSTLSDEFRDIWPDVKNPEGWYQKNSDTKLLRAGLGVYAFGTLDGAAARALPLDEAWHKLEADLPQVMTASDFSQILSPIRELAGQIKNAPVSIKPETEKISVEWPGSITAHQAWLPNGQLAREVQPYALDQLTREGAEGWLMLSRYRDQLPLLTAAADPSRAKDLEAWIHDVYFPRWAEALQKELGSSADPAFWEFFEAEPLSSTDLRLLTLFAAQNWLGVRPRLPADTKIASLPATPVFSKDRAPQAFLGVPVLTGSQQAWAGFWAFDSGFFTGPEELKGLLDKLPRDAATVKQEFLRTAEDTRTLTQGRLNIIDREKLSGTQKLMLQLQTVSSLYQSRGLQRLVPAVGFDDFCAQGQGVGDCPFTVSSFASWRRFLEERILDHFCPFVSGSLFSTGFQKQWREALGFQDSPAELAQLCAGHTSLKVEGFPTAVWEQNASHLLHMGRNPHLKPALQQLPEAMRRLKIQRVSGDYQKFVRFQELTPLWIPTASARLQHREGVYSAFRWRSPGLVDHVLAAYNHEVGDKVFTDALKKLGRLSHDGGNPVFDLIHAVTETYAESVQTRETTLTFILRLADRISQDPQLIQTTSRLLEKPEDPFAGILLAYTFPQAMKVGVFEDFAWDHPSYKLMRLAFQPENRRLMLGLVAAFDRLSPKLWKIYQDAASVYPDRSTMAHDLEKLLQFAVDALSSADGDGELSRLWQGLFQKRLSDETLASGIRLTHLLREPLVDLNNTWQPPLLEKLDDGLHATITGILRMIPWLEKLPADQSFDLMLNAWLGLAPGIYAEDGTGLWQLMQDKRLGLGDQGIIALQLRDRALRAELRFILKTLWSLESSWVLAALDEWESLAVSTEKVLHYFERHVQWRGPGAVSYQYFIKTLDYQMQDGQRLLREQLDLFRRWLLPESCIRGNTECQE